MWVSFSIRFEAPDASFEATFLNALWNLFRFITFVLNKFPSYVVSGDAVLMHGAIHDVSNYIFPSGVAKWREINHVNNGRRINSFTTLTPSRKFSCLNRKHIFRTLHPIIALVKCLFYARKEQWPRGWDGGIVIDHAMGWKKREKEKEVEGKEGNPTKVL